MQHSKFHPFVWCIFLPACLLTPDTSAGESRQEDHAIPIDDVLSWLPSDTETLFVARGPFAITEDDNEAEFSFHNAIRCLPMSHLGSTLVVSVAAKRGECNSLLETCG